MWPFISVLSQQAILQLMASFSARPQSKVLRTCSWYFVFTFSKWNVVFIGAQFSSKPLLLTYPVCYKLYLGSKLQIVEFKTNGLTFRDSHLKLKLCQTLCYFKTLISHLLHLIAILAGERKEMEIFNNFISTWTEKDCMRQRKVLFLPQRCFACQVSEAFWKHLRWESLLFLRQVC